MLHRLSYWFFRLVSALRWYRGASIGKDVQNPRLQAFVREVYEDDRFYHAFKLIRSVRGYWSRKSGRVRLRSLGAPSKTTTKRERTIRSLVASNAIAEREGQLLFRLALWLDATSILEFGTNAGISTLYLHAANTQARLDTVEGNPEVAALARETFAKAGTGPGLQAHVGLFEAWLKLYPQGVVSGVPGSQQGQKQATTTPPLDLFFLDGDHREIPTCHYVETLLPRATEKTVFVIADIHWSPGMERAWAKVKALPQVKASLDVYHFGLLFFDAELAAEHKILAPNYYKPWRLR